MEKQSKIALTGDRPTGKLHLGHFVGSIQNRIKLQEEAEQSFYMVADIQALTDNADNPEKVRDNVLEVTLDNLACGIDPTKTTMFIQSQVQEIAELTVLFMNLVTLQQLSHNPTIKTEAKEKGFSLDSKFDTNNPSEVLEDSIKEIDTIVEQELKGEPITTIDNSTVGKGIPFGFLAYPVSQAADILFCKANIIPVGEDQKAVIEITREIARKFNNIYKEEVFPEPKELISDTPRLVGIDGNSKMGKSLNNAIYLSDSYEEISKKVMDMYTDPNHIKVENPGQVEGNVVFTYLDIFDNKKEEVTDLKKQYQKGGLGDVVLKKRLIEVLENVIAPIRTRREELAKDPEKVMQILRDGTDQARVVARETMKEVREAIKINYFK